MPESPYELPVQAYTPNNQGPGCDEFVSEMIGGDGRFGYEKDRLTVAGVDVAGLADEFGTPLYVYAGDQIAERAQMLQKAFATQEHTVCYAVKANSSLAIMKMLGGLGCGLRYCVWRGARACTARGA